MKIICNFPESYCEHQDRSLGLYTCNNFHCVKTDYSTTNRTIVDRNGQDNKTIMNNYDYYICPHCGNKVYK